MRILERYAQDYERDRPGLVQDAMSLQSVLPIPSRYTNYAWHVAILLDDTGHPMEALALCAYLVEHYRQSGDQENLADALYNQAVIIHAHGDLDGAMALYQEQERLCRELGRQDGLARSLAGQALLLSQMGRSHEALPLAEEAYLLATTHGFAALARQIKPILDAVRSSGERTSVEAVSQELAGPGLASTPHPGADPERAVRLNIQHQQDLARWKALPWLKRLCTKKPEPPTGI